MSRNLERIFSDSGMFLDRDWLLDLEMAQEILSKLPIDVKVLDEKLEDEKVRVQIKCDNSKVFDRFWNRVLETRRDRLKEEKNKLGS